MPFIDIVQPEQAEGNLKAIYDDLIKSRGKIAEVHKIQSLNPKSITDHMNLYMTIMFGKSPLKRVQREMLGVIVSKANNCRYCQVHHAEAVNHYWKDDDKTQQLIDNYVEVALSETDLLLCNYAWVLTKDPDQDMNNRFIRPLRNLGLSDRAILDATLVVSYFNFVNRLVLSLGLELEDNPGGYNYD